MHIFGAPVGLALEIAMAHLLVDRSSLAEFQTFGYRFGRIKGKSARGALRRLGNAVRPAIEAIVNSKLRRMERELELRGISTRGDR